jgi:hypothetical protein
VLSLNLYPSSVNNHANYIVVLLNLTFEQIKYQICWDRHCVSNFPDVMPVAQVHPDLSGERYCNRNFFFSKITNLLDGEKKETEDRKKLEKLFLNNRVNRL